MTATAKPETTKLSAADLLTRLTALQRVLELQLRPCPLLIYKPNQAGTGAALKLDWRLEPQYNEFGYLVPATKDDGGVFATWANQKGETDENGNALFAWENAITAKLGWADLTQILYGMQCRITRTPVPGKSENKDTVALVHKFKKEGGQESTTVIKYTLNKSGAFFSVSKSAKERCSIKLTESEELGVREYLTEALKAVHFVGKR